MSRSERFEFRVDPEEGRRLRLLAERADRSPSDLLRLILRQLDPNTVSSGIPSPTSATEQAAEQEMAVA